MASPSQAISRVELSSGYEEFDLAASRQGFIGPRVAKPRPVARQSGEFGYVPVEQLLQNRTTRRAPGTGYNRGSFEFETLSFATEEHGVEEKLDDREIKQYSDLLDAETIHAQRAIDAIARAYEIEVADAIFNATTFASYTDDVTEEWDDADSATPMTDVETARRAIESATGLRPNALIINRKVFHNLKQTDEIVDRLKYAGFDDMKTIGANALAQLFDLDFVLVAGGYKNTADEGQDASIEPIWSDEYAMVCKVATTRDPSEACVARTFVWAEEAGMDNGEEICVVIEEYRTEDTRSSILRARSDWDIQVIHAAAGYLLSNITS